MNTFEEQVKDPCEFMSNLSKTLMPLDRWGFQESYRSKESGQLIINSQWCRVNFVWGGWNPSDGNTMSIYYGRLHALNEGIKMQWDGKECRCWHTEELALHLLDESTPKDAAKSIYTHRIIKEYREADIRQNLTGSSHQPEWLVRMHVAIWAEYAPRLFEVFDLRRPDLWQRYRKFLKEVYEINGHNPAITLPMDQVC